MRVCVYICALRICDGYFNFISILGVLIRLLTVLYYSISPCAWIINFVTVHCYLILLRALVVFLHYFSLLYHIITCIDYLIIITVNYCLALLCALIINFTMQCSLSHIISCLDYVTFCYYIEMPYVFTVYFTISALLFHIGGR